MTARVADLGAVAPGEEAWDVGPFDVRQIIEDTLAAEEIDGHAEVAAGVAAVHEWLSQQALEGCDEILDFLRDWPTLRTRDDGTTALRMVLRRIQSALTDSVH